MSQRARKPSMSVPPSSGRATSSFGGAPTSRPCAASTPNSNSTGSSISWTRSLVWATKPAAPSMPRAVGRRTKSSVPVERVYGCILDATSLVGVIEEARAAGKIALALETTTADAMRGEIVGISLATRAGRGHYVPLTHRYLGCPPQLAWARVREVLAPLLADPRIVKVGHDLKENAIVLQRAGAPLEWSSIRRSRRRVPTRSGVAKRIEGALTPRTRCESFSVRRGPTGIHSGREDTQDARSAASVRGDRRRARGHVRRRRCGRSRWPCEGTAFEPRLAPEGLDRLMRDVEMPLSRVLADMEMRGVLVDVGTLEKLGHDVELELREIEADCKRIAGQDFVLRSRDQLEEDSLRRPAAARRQANAEGGAIDGRRRSRSTRRPASTAEAYFNVSRARQAQRDLHRCSAQVRQSKHRAHSHEVRSGGCRDWTSRFERSQSPEHSHSHRTRARDPRRVRRARRARRTQR